MTDSNSIKNWLEDDRPREKMLQKGADALSDAELLAILIASGTREKSALDLARETLALAKNNLRELGRISIKDMQRIKGIGMARAITIGAAMELGRRRQLADGLDRQSVSTTRDAVNIIAPLLEDLTEETFCALYLNTASKVLHYELLTNGGITSTVVDIRIILKNALMLSATRLIVAHNHPSGSKTASQYDKDITRKLRDAASIMDITLLDHIIIAGRDYVSMANEGII